MKLKDTRYLVERWEVGEAHTAPRNYRLWGWATTLLVLFFVLCALGFVLALNAAIPGGW